MTASPAHATGARLGKPYVVCAFYTPDYAQVVAGLAECLAKQGLDHHLEEVQPAGSWEANTRLKPGFIARCLTRFPDRDILYLDADARIHQAPVLFDAITTDVAIRLFRVTKRGRTWLRPSANTIYFRNTAASRALVDAWVRLTARAKPHEVDEDTLCRALDKAGSLSITALPLAYAKVFDAAGGAPVIEQLQVSRNKPRALRRQRQRRLWLAIGAGVFGLAGLAWALS